MKIGELFPSNWLKKEDLPHPVVATIRAVTQEKIKGERGDELKPVLHFLGSLKPMVLNRGNATIISSIYGDDITNWPNKIIEVYADPSVMFAGRLVGGIRLRAPQGHAPRQGHNGAAPMTFAQAQQQCEQVGISKDALLAAIKAAGIKNTAEPGFAPLVRKLIADKVANEQGGELDSQPLEDYVDAALSDIPF